MENQQDNNVVVTSSHEAYKVEGSHDHLAPMGHHVVSHHHHGIAHLNHSHHSSIPLDHHHHHHHHLNEDHHQEEELVGGEEENVEAIVVEHGNHSNAFNQFGASDYSTQELNYGSNDPPFVTDQSNYSNQHSFGPEADYPPYHVPHYEESKTERRTEKDFVDMIGDYVAVFEGHVYVEYEALMKRFQSRKRNYDHYKMSIQDVIERNGKKYMPIKELVRFFESNGFTLHETYETWKRHLISEAVVHQMNKKEKKRKRNEVYDISPLGLMSCCDCQTSKLVPKKQRLAVKPLHLMTDTHYAKLRATQLMSTIEELLSNLKQSFNDVFFFKATHDMDWFKELLSRFFNSAPRCEAVVREVVNEKKPSSENIQRTRSAVNTLKGLKEGGIICEPEGEINHNVVENYSDINLSNSEH
eukprot:TRINITY_DN1774_c0_g1_i1.p1 TRINITY_DN1774_c0_g1~~TRINITY_DN1774_c0_g1_i1.p1  ORF type:complete len:413 (-),score=92.76 TRINITY_DN1774_c0_g1_i1:70-1308(-)